MQSRAKKQGIRGENGRRLQAIISAKGFGITAVAKIYNISRRTLFRWIAAFKEKGCAGFDAAPGRGRPARITEDHIPKIKEIVEKEGAILTSQKLKIKLQEEFDVNVSKNTAYKYLKKLDYVYITPRPRHHKKDDSLQVGAIKKYKGRN